MWKIFVFHFFFFSFLIAGEPPDTNESFNITEVIVEAVEHDEWSFIVDNIDSLVKTNGIPMLIDSLKSYYNGFCSLMLVDKITGDFYNGLAMVCYEAELYGPAINCFASACSLCRKYEYQEGIYANICNQVVTYSQMKDTVIPIEIMSEALKLFMERGNLYDFDELEGFVSVLSEVSRLDDIIKSLEQNFISIGDKGNKLLGELHFLYGVLLYQSDSLNQSADKITKAVKYCIKSNNPKGEWFSRLILSRLLAAQEKPLSEINENFAKALITGIKNDSIIYDGTALFELWQEILEKCESTDQFDTLLFSFVDWTMGKDPDRAEIRAKIDCLIALGDILALSLEQREDLVEKALKHWADTKNTTMQIAVLSEFAEYCNDQGAQEQAIPFLQNALVLSLNSKDWNKAYYIIKAAFNFGVAEGVIKNVLKECNDWAKATIYAMNGYFTIMANQDEETNTTGFDNLQLALQIYERLNDKLGQARVYQFLGDVYNDVLAQPDQTESNYWSAYFTAFAANDTIFAEGILYKAANACQKPEKYLEAFDMSLKNRKTTSILALRYRIDVADGLRQKVNEFYGTATAIFESCADNAEDLNDIHLSEINNRIATLNFYSGYTEGIDNLDSTKLYRPLSADDMLKNIKREDLDTLIFYLDDVIKSSEERGTDTWCTNYLNELKGYAYLGWANVLRSYAEIQYTEALRQLKTLNVNKGHDLSIDHFLLRAQIYRGRVCFDSLLDLYNNLQRNLAGRIYNAAPSFIGKRIYDLILEACKIENPRQVNLLKYDCLGFADRKFEYSGYMCGAGPGGGETEAEPPMPPEKCEKSEEEEELKPVTKLTMSVRFNYLDVRPPYWLQPRLENIANVLAIWEKNLFWVKEEHNRWQLLQVSLQIELGNFKLADSLLRTNQGFNSINPWTQAVFHLSRGNVNEILGRYQDGINDYEWAHRLGSELNDNEFLTACIAGNTGNLYLTIGDYAKAWQAYEAVFNISQQKPELKLLYARILLACGNIKLIEALKDKKQEVLESILGYYTAVQKIMTDIIEMNTYLTAELNMSIVEHLLGNNAEADSLIASVIDTASAYEILPVAAAGFSIKGYFQSSREEYEQAIESYESAIQGFRAMGNRYALSNALTLLGSALKKLGKGEEAYTNLKESIDIFESLREQIESEGITNLFTEANLDRYGKMIGLLIDLNRPEEAFSYIERSKSKSLKDAIDITKLEPVNVKLREVLKDASTLNSNIVQYEKELTEEMAQVSDKRDSTKIVKLSKVLASTKSEFLSLESQVKKLNPDYEALIKITPGQLAKIQTLIPTSTIFLEYYSAIDGLYIFEVTNNTFKVHRVEVKRDSIYTLIKMFRGMIAQTALSVKSGMKVEPINSWEDDGSDRYQEEIKPLKEVITTLYCILLAPINQDIAENDEIIIIPAGLLTYLPFHALAHESAEGFKFFIEEKNISYLTSAELIDIVKEKMKKEKPASLLGFGNPDGSLPSALNEVEAIKTVFPKSEIFTLAQATEDKAIDLSNNYNILHFATHALLDDKVPDESYILLSKGQNNDGKWHMNEIFGVTWNKMNLVVLSACETALGQKDPGREVATLAYAFSVAGTPSIIASLWPVYDPSTQSLMKTFYENLKKQDKVNSLRAAQVSLLKDSRYAHPFFWAPFVLIGDWR